MLYLLNFLARSVLAKIMHNTERPVTDWNSMLMMMNDDDDDIHVAVVVCCLLFVCCLECVCVCVCVMC